MDSLIRLIGPAPSELSFDDFLEKLSLERDRVRRNLIWFQTHAPTNSPAKKEAKARPGKKQAKLATVAKKEGLSPEDIRRALEIARQRKEEQNGNT